MAKIEINPKLIALLEEMADAVIGGQLLDQCRVADRMLKLEAIKKGTSGDRKGSAFDDDFDPDEEDDKPLKPEEKPNDNFADDQ